jgi:hypothetical protein
VDIWSLCQTFYTVATLENPKGTNFQNAAAGKKNAKFPAFPEIYNDSFK